MIVTPLQSAWRFSRSELSWKAGAVHPNESANAEAERILYFTLVSALETALVRAMEDALSVLRQASQPLGPMGAEWLEQQARALKREDGS